MNLHIAVCDDNEIITEIIHQKLIHHNSNYKIDIYHSGEKLLAAETIYDLIFLDIEMLEINGMEVAVTLRRNNFDGHIVFLSGHTEFMSDAFKVKAFRFLTKPIVDEHFEEAITAIESDFKKNKKIVIKTTQGKYSINRNDILYIEAARNMTYIHTIEGELETKIPLQNWLKDLGTTHFYPVHRSYIVSLKHMKTIEDGKIILHHTNSKIPLAKRRITKVNNVFSSYAEKYAICQ